MPARNALTLYLRILAATLFGALILVLTVVLSPIRWDAKSLRNVWVHADEPIPPGSRIIFVSTDNEWQSGHAAGYGLELSTFPTGESLWVIPHENYRNGPWTPDLLLKADGTFESPRQAKSKPPPRLDPGTVLLLSSPGLRSILEQRWPASHDASVRVLDRRPTPIVGATRWLSWTQLSRLSLLALVVGGWIALTWQILRTDSIALRVLAAALGLPVWVCLHVVLMYALGKLSLTPSSSALALEGIAVWTVLFLWITARKQQRSGIDVATRTARRSPELVVVGLLVLLHLAFSVVRRDFDGDMLTHWLPAASSYYYMGDHDIQFLTERYGVAHEATYPPAFPIFVASLLWVAAADPANSLAPGIETHVFVFLYRLALALLCTSALVAVGALILCVAPRAWLVGLLCPVLFLLVVPLLSGTPMAGEVFLVPIVTAALLAWVAAELLGRPHFAWVAVLLALFTLLIKNDAKVILPLVILPWAALANRQTLRRVWIAAVLVIPPWLLWQWDTSSLGAAAHFAFEPLSWGGLMARRMLVPGLYGNAAELLLASPAWVVVLLVLPGMLVWLCRAQRWREIAVPLGAGIYIALLPLLCAFSRGDLRTNLIVSFERIASVAVVSLLVFGLWLALTARADATEPGLVERLRSKPGGSSKEA